MEEPLSAFYGDRPPGAPLRPLASQGPQEALVHILGRAYYRGVWQRRFLVAAGVCELALLVPGAIFGTALGYHSFVAGEMGTMVGILLLAVLVPILPYGVLRIFALVGVWKRRRWGAILAIALSAAAAVGGLVVALDTPGVLAVILLYAALSGWAAAGCLKHPSFGPRTP